MSAGPSPLDAAVLVDPVRVLRARRRAGEASGSTAQRAVDDQPAARARRPAEAGPAAGDGSGLARAVGAAAGSAGLLLGVGDLHAAVDGVREHTWGLGPLTPLMADTAVTDVLVNGGGAVWVDRGDGPVPAGVRLAGEPEVRALAVRLATLAGRRLDDAMPWVDARLPDGVRLHAVVPPLAPEGTHVSLRVLRAGGFDLEGLVARGAVPGPWADVLAAMVRRRVAFLVSGGTGAGKTTLLAALLGLVTERERLVLVEDVGELRPDHPHVVRLEARHDNVEGRGAVGLDELVRMALRMRPDRIVVGECRGAEVRELLAALNTGHAGGCGTVHANACAEVPARLEALGSLAGLSPRALVGQVAAAIDVVVHVERVGGVRRVAEIAVVGRDGRRGLLVEPALTRDPDGVPMVAAGWPRLAALLEGPGDGHPRTGAPSGGSPAGSARSLGSGGPMGWAGALGSVGSLGSAGSAGSAGSSGSGRSAGSAGSLGSAGASGPGLSPGSPRPARVGERDDRGTAP